MKESRSYCALKTDEENKEETKTNMHQHKLSSHSLANSIPISSRGRSSTRSPFRNVSQEQYDIVNDVTCGSDKDEKPIPEAEQKRPEQKRQKDFRLENYNSNASKKKKT